MFKRRDIIYVCVYYRMLLIRCFPLVTNNLFPFKIKKRSICVFILDYDILPVLLPLPSAVQSLWEEYLPPPPPEQLILNDWLICSKVGIYYETDQNKTVDLNSWTKLCTLPFKWSSRPPSTMCLVVLKLKVLFSIVVWLFVPF